MSILSKEIPERNAYFIGIMVVIAAILSIILVCIFCVFPESQKTNRLNGCAAYGGQYTTTSQGLNCTR